MPQLSKYIFELLKCCLNTFENIAVKIQSRKTFGQNYVRDAKILAKYFHISQYYLDLLMNSITKILLNTVSIYVKIQSKARKTYTVKQC